MKQVYTLLFALLMIIGVLGGCGQDAAEEPKNSESPQTKKEHSVVQEESEFPVTITDALDNEVVIEKKPERIVSLVPSNTEITFALGLGEEIVGVTTHDNYPAEVGEKEKVGGLDFNVEKVVSLKPNLVLAHGSSADSLETALQQLRDSGIIVLIVNDAKSFSEVYESINMIGAATGEMNKAESLVMDLKAKIQEIEEIANQIKSEDRKTVFVEVFPEPEIFSVGANTFMDEMLQIINAKNVVTEEGWPKIDEEAIIERNPDVIITTHGHYSENPVETVMSRDGWQAISAVKNEKVVNVDSDTVNRTGPRIAQGVEELAKAVYPELFE
jgi:iron complex transport system substrate-binding protein